MHLWCLVTSYPAQCRSTVHIYEKSKHHKLHQWYHFISCVSPMHLWYLVTQNYSTYISWLQIVIKRTSMYDACQKWGRTAESRQILSLWVVLQRVFCDLYWIVWVGVLMKLSYQVTYIFAFHILKVCVWYFVCWKIYFSNVFSVKCIAFEEYIVYLQCIVWVGALMKLRYRVT